MASSTNILVVDDEPRLLSTMSRILRTDDWSVVTAPDGHTALDLIDRDTFDVVVSDYKMPGIDGLEFLERSRAVAPEAQRILVTGMGDTDLAIRAINRGQVTGYLAKPFLPDELRSAVRQAVERGTLITENRRLTEQVKARNLALECLNSSLQFMVEERTMQVLRGLLSALHTRDTETRNHSTRVSTYARLVASRLGVEGQALIDIERGALLHDIGKIGVPDAILRKPGPLTPDEWVEMEKHPELGHAMLANIDFLAEAQTIVLQHQERWDGKGYPAALSGDRICLGARIFAVVDAFDAMTSDRPYRRALRTDVARKEIARCAGTQFDPTVVAAFLAIPDEELGAIRHASPD